MGVGQAVDRLAGGGGRDPVPGPEARTASPVARLGAAGAGRAEEDDVLPSGDEVRDAQGGDHVALEAAGVVGVEVITTGATTGCGAFQVPRFLAAGDLVRMEIRGLGVMETPGMDDEWRPSLCPRTRIPRKDPGAPTGSQLAADRPTTALGCGPTRAPR